MAENLRVSMVQSHIIWEDRNENLGYYGELLRRISGKTDLAVLPETFSTGFTMNIEPLADEADGITVNTIKKWAADYKMAVAGSFIAKDNGKYYNRAFFITSEGDSLFYDKRHLFQMGHEDQYFTAGDKRLVVSYRGWNICLLVCYDLRFPVWSRRTAKENYDLLLYVANWPERRSHAWKSLLPARAIENQSYVVGLNRVGLDGNNINYSGDSVALNFLGETLISANPGEAAVLQVTLSKPELLHFRKSFPAEQDADQFILNV